MKLVQLRNPKIADRYDISRMCDFLQMMFPEKMDCLTDGKVRPYVADPNKAFYIGNREKIQALACIRVMIDSRV